jgi:hypothetical protein
MKLSGFGIFTVGNKHNDDAVKEWARKMYFGRSPLSRMPTQP